MMIFTSKLKEAIRFATKTHDVYQKQKRKGKDVAYITHPLAVGIILSQAEADEEVVIAGILHDTIEDSVLEKKVTRAMIAERFGERVANIVMDVTETRKELPWEERKKEALEHIKTFSEDSLLVKAADVISNVSELLYDYSKNGDDTFSRFNAPKDKILLHSLSVIKQVLEKWPESPLAKDLTFVRDELLKI
jgi:(p)ppGpp synthase/HD superfamily hydrolase